MDKLNLPKIDLKISKTEDNKYWVYDISRKKDIVLTPEEWVRQHFIHYLIGYLEYPLSLIKVESGHSTALMKRRTDIIVYDNTGHPAVLIECKRPEESINQTVIDQVVRYNSVIKSRYIVVTNGIKHYCSQYDLQNDQYTLINFIPDYNKVRIS